MDAILYAGLNNAAWTALLALAAAVGTRLWRRIPAVGHALWLMVLLKLVLPSLVQFSLPHAGPRVREARSAVAPIGPIAEPGPVRIDPDAAHEGRWPEGPPPGATAETSAPERRVPPGRPSKGEAGRGMAVPVMAASWLLGAFAWWSMVSLNSARFRDVIRSARPASAELRGAIERVAGRLGLRTVPGACLLPIRISPMVWVPLLGPPLLVLPEELWGRLDPTQQDAILAHELAHLKRRDHWVRRLEALACGLFWWDPVAWWASREVGRAEERCCDAWVLWALPTAAGAYAEALVMTASYLSRPRRPLPLGASGVGRLGFLKGRLQMILSDPTTISPKRKSSWALLALGAISLPFLPAPISGGTPVAAAQAPAGDPQSKPATPPAEPDQKPNDAAKSGGPQEIPPPPMLPPGLVRVMQPIVREVTDHAEFVGHILAASDVDLRARVSGTILEVNCRPDQVVKPGDLLFKLDSRLYKAAFDQADAEVAKTQARQQLKLLQLSMVKKQVESHAVSANEANLAHNEFEEADAAMRAAKAARDIARFNLDFTEVKAPLAGRVSGVVLGQGNVAVADTTHLASIVSANQVWLTFNVSEGASLQLRRQTPRPAEATVSLADGTDYPHVAKIDSTEARFDPATGTALWRASIPNPDGLLLPGMSVRVKLALGGPHKAILVPVQSLLEERKRNVVFVVNGQDVARKCPVKISNEYDGFYSLDGLQPGEWVVIDDVKNIQEGEKIRAKRLPPPAETSPPDGIKP